MIHVPFNPRYDPQKTHTHLLEFSSFERNQSKLTHNFSFSYVLSLLKNFHYLRRRKRDERSLGYSFDLLFFLSSALNKAALLSDHNLY